MCVCCFVATGVKAKGSGDLFDYVRDYRVQSGQDLDRHIVCNLNYGDVMSINPGALKKVKLVPMTVQPVDVDGKAPAPSHRRVRLSKADQASALREALTYYKRHRTALPSSANVIRCKCMVVRGVWRSSR